MLRHWRERRLRLLEANLSDWHSALIVCEDFGGMARRALRAEQMIARLERKIARLKSKVDQSGFLTRGCPVRFTLSGSSGPMQFNGKHPVNWELANLHQASSGGR